MQDGEGTMWFGHNVCPAVEHPMTTLIRLLRMHLEICDDLERVADSLPDQVDRDKCRQLTGLLGTIIRPVHELEERVVFPRIATGGGFVGFQERTLERLRREHCMDCDYAAEIAELLDGLCNRTCCVGMNAVGYALRGFFESLRRHVYFDLEQIIPAAQCLLLREDVQQMAEILRPHQVIVSQACLQTRRSITTRHIH